MCRVLMYMFIVYNANEVSYLLSSIIIIIGIIETIFIVNIILRYTYEIEKY